jgi:Asp-tRNA(Asn)/Glu-tRNA(Gln) amidotransferase A subunit family amidase
VPIAPVSAPNETFREKRHHFERNDIMRMTNTKLLMAAAVLSMALLIQPLRGFQTSRAGFDVMETTIEEVHSAYSAGRLTARELTQMYLDRIKAYDQQGPKINSVITVNPRALEEADRLDRAFKTSGLVGTLHGIPVLIKDELDVAGLPTTLGSVILKDYVPTRDGFVTEKLKKAGAIVLAKMTLGEFASGDTYGSLFGDTRNPYDLSRTVGGSSGGSAAGLAANFGAIGIGQELQASIRRPSTWNSVVGMRPTAGLVSRSGVWGGWPSTRGTLGPMTRTVADLAKLLDVMVGYDPEDPLTALGVGHIPRTYTAFLDRNGLKGARVGILRDTNPSNFDPDSADFKNVATVFEKAVAELKGAGAEVVDPLEIPDLKKLMNEDRSVVNGPDSAAIYFSRNPNSPFKTLGDLLNAPGYRGTDDPGAAGKPGAEFSAREELLINLLKVMADHNLDAIAHKSIEQGPPLLHQGNRGVPRLNTFLIYAASMTVPAGFTSDGLPVGITFLGRPFSEPTVIKLAYAYEQATHHRKPPSTTPRLPSRR